MTLPPLKERPPRGELDFMMEGSLGDLANYDLPADHQGNQPRSGKRRRSDHNELERQRRIAQRGRIDELRDVLPMTSTVRVSTVNIVVKAKEYIQDLQRRVAQLESLCSQYVPPEAYRASLGHLPTIVIDTSHMHSLAPKPQQTMQSSPQGSPKHRKLNAAPQEEEDMKRKILEYFVTHRLSTAVRPTEVSGRRRSARRSSGASTSTDLAKQVSESSGAEDFVIGKGASTFQERRNSSLLFSAGTGVFWSNRDNSYGAETAPSLFPIEEELHVDIRCGKCCRGLENLVMVDCQKCKQWFHIRCVGISPNNIPLTWTCPEC